jgi:hypothetical protein
VSIEPVNPFKEPVEVSMEDILLSFDDVYDWKVVSSNLPVPIACPFNVIEPVILTEPVTL